MSLFDQVISASDAEAPAFRQAPEGDYLASVKSVRKVKANSGNEGIEVTFTLQEALTPGLDTDGVTLSKCRVRHTFWVTENTREFVARDLARIEPETVGHAFSEAMEMLPSAETVIKIKHITQDRNGRDLATPWLKVGTFYTRAWYFENKLKAA